MIVGGSGDGGGEDGTFCKNGANVGESVVGDGLGGLTGASDVGKGVGTNVGWLVGDGVVIIVRLPVRTVAV